MKIYSIFDPEFRPYGKVLTGFDTSALVAAMQTVPMPERGTAYEPAIEALETCGIFDAMQNRAYSGMPVQIGMCWGYNTKLNCLEYHRDSEVNVGETDFVLLLAKEDEIEDGMLDTAKVKAFRVPAGTLPSRSMARRSTMRRVRRRRPVSALPSSCRRARTWKSPRSSQKAKKTHG